MKVLLNKEVELVVKEEVSTEVDEGLDVTDLESVCLESEKVVFPGIP